MLDVVASQHSEQGAGLWVKNSDRYGHMITVYGIIEITKIRMLTVINIMIFSVAAFSGVLFVLAVQTTGIMDLSDDQYGVVTVNLI